MQNPRQDLTTSIEESRDMTLNLNISQYPSNSVLPTGNDMLVADDLYDMPRKVDFSASGINEDKIVQIPLSELDLLQSCQKIIDAA